MLSTAEADVAEILTACRAVLALMAVASDDAIVDSVLPVATV